MKTANLILRILLAIVGVVIFIIGLDVAFGGIRTLGWLGPTDFLEVVNASDFNVQDNHFRFLGGTWIGIGLVFVAGAFAFQRMRTALVTLCAVVFVGGLARFSTPDLATLAHSSVLPSLLAELIMFPLLGLWISKSGEDRP